MASNHMMAPMHAGPTQFKENARNLVVFTGANVIQAARTASAACLGKTRAANITGRHRCMGCCPAVLLNELQDRQEAQLTTAGALGFKAPTRQPKTACGCSWLRCCTGSAQEVAGCRPQHALNMLVPRAQRPQRRSAAAGHERMYKCSYLAASKASAGWSETVLQCESEKGQLRQRPAKQRPPSCAMQKRAANAARRGQPLTQQNRQQCVQSASRPGATAAQDPKALPPWSSAAAGLHPSPTCVQHSYLQGGHWTVP